MDILTRSYQMIFYHLPSTTFPTPPSHARCHTWLKTVDAGCSNIWRPVSQQVIMKPKLWLSLAAGSITKTFPVISRHHMVENSGCSNWRSAPACYYAQAWSPPALNCRDFSPLFATFARSYGDHSHSKVERSDAPSFVFDLKWRFTRSTVFIQ